MAKEQLQCTHKETKPDIYIVQSIPLAFTHNHIYRYVDYLISVCQSSTSY